MSVFLLDPSLVVPGLPPLASASYEQLQRGFGTQVATAHQPASNAESADIILAPVQSTGYGLCLEDLRRSPTYRWHADKLIVYCPDDNQFPAVRGLYPSTTRQWVRRGWSLPAHYISSHIHRFHFDENELREKDLLFSFVGSSRTHPVREAIVGLMHPDGVLIDSSSRSEKSHWWEGPDPDRFFKSFRDVTRRSRFVICPRGVSPSSIRLYEAMEAAAVPIIVADDIELPSGPAWAEFSLRVREQDVASIPAVTELYDDRAIEMGWAARRAWEAHFSEQATIGSIVRWGWQLMSHSHRRSTTLKAAEYLNPRRFKAKMRRALG